MPVTSKSVVDDKEPSSSKGAKAPYVGGATANCTIRCSVEKRSYCRELQKWSKNLLYMVGLENVAKKLTDRKSWIKISPFIESDPSRSKCEERKPIADCLDWNPEEHCPICKGKGKEQKPSKSVENHKHHQPLETKQQTKETVANSISSPPIDFFDMQSSLQRNSLENLITYPAVPYFDLSQAYLSQLMLHWSKLAPFSLHPPIGPLMLPFAPPNLLQTSASSSATLCDPSAIYQNGATASTLSNSADEPLDLSVKTHSNTNAHHNSTKSNKTAPPQSVTQNQQQQQAQPPLMLSAQPNVANGATSKKAYSQADLEAAVQDIRCGKLGTRRASVVYGIPRSTLRNKIYKLEASEEGGAGGSGRSKRKKTAVATTTTVVNSVAKIIDANAKACVKASTPAAATASVVVRTSPIGSLLTSSEESSETNGSAIQTYCQSAAAEKLVHELAKYKVASISQCCWALTNGSPIDDQDSTASSTTIGKNETCRSVLVKSLVDDAAHSALHDQLLKTRNNHVASIVDGCSGGGDSGAAAVVGRSGRNNKRSTNSSRRGGGKSCENILHAVKRPRSANSNGNLSSDCSQSALLANGSIDAQRKVRPKRGQYRRYDKNALAEAVQSVRRGEMSVHRAGSYYGVPHSTLEYKVKERNLLRPKKRDQTRQNRAAAAAAAVAATAAESSTTTAASGKSSARRNSVAARRDSASAGSAVDSPLNNCIAADTVTPIADECDEISSPVKKRCRDDDDNDEDDDDEENSTERRLVIENDEDAPMIDGEASNGLEQRQLPAVVPI